jgi:hypothetical protein
MSFIGFSLVFFLSKAALAAGEAERYAFTNL